MTQPPDGYLGTEGRVRSGPSPALVAAGYRLETDDATFLHKPLCLADLAHLLELRQIGVIPEAAAKALGAGLLTMLDTPAEDFPYDPEYGDAYNSREVELERTLGEASGWLPTGRTRREAGRIAFRLVLRSRLLDLHDSVAAFGRAVVARAIDAADVVWNDTTYLQPAQPSTFGHYLAGFAEAVVRDLERIRSAHRWANRSPAGVGGVAGTSVPLDRIRLAARLGFDEIGANTRDVMWAADGLTDAVVAAAQSVINADRLAEDLEIFTSPQFDYVTLAGSSTRASVLLPQKRNPYALAVIRGGAGTLIGRVAGMMATQRTPSARTDNWLYAYGETVASIDLAARLLTLATDVVTNMTINRATLVASAGFDFSASADLSERLTLDHGLDYRSAYRLVGRAAANASDQGRRRFQPGDLTAAAIEMGVPPPPEPTLDEGLLALGRNVVGGSAPRRVMEHCESVEKRIADSVNWARSARESALRAETDIIEQSRRAWARRTG